MVLAEDDSSDLGAKKGECRLSDVSQPEQTRPLHWEPLAPCTSPPDQAARVTPKRQQLQGPPRHVVIVFLEIIPTLKV